MKAITQKALRGFTLIEVLVALVLVSLLSLLAWRAMDGMARAGEMTGQHEQNLQRIDAGLAQWSADLDAIADTGTVAPLDFDGQHLRLTRHSSVPNSGIVVVAWTLRETAQGRMWQRFMSPAVTTKNSLQDAWSQAGRWARTPLPEDAAYIATLFAVRSWQLNYFRDNAWTNPQSAVGGAAETAPRLPDGVQLVLDVPAGSQSPLSGKLTKYWLVPTFGATQ